MGDDNERVVKQISQLEAVKTRSMYTGSQEKQTIDMHILEEGKFILKPTEFVPTWYKIVDEVLVNAIDHWVNYPKKVKVIKISFDTINGEITVLNDGPGIPCKKITLVDGREIYTAQAICSEFQTGSNFNDEDRRTGGGCNGLGNKLTNAFSDYFEITTLDEKAKKIYKQMFRNRLDTIDAPEITKSNKGDKGFTQIRFLPCYKQIGYLEGLKENDISQLLSLVESRAYQAAAFTTGVDVYFNDVKLEMPENENTKATVFEKFSHMFLHENEYGLYHTNITDGKEAWEIGVAPSNGKFQQISNINGIWVYKGGSHIKHLQKELIDNLKPLVEKELKSTKNKFNNNYVLNNLFLFVKGSIVNPEFQSQVKDAISDPIAKFKEYKFSSKDIKAIWTLLKDHILSQFLDKVKDKAKTKVNRGKVILDAGEDAKMAGHKTHALKCSLFIAEGLSALSLVTRAINHKKTELNKDYSGTYSISGVPPNARKECKEILNKKDGTVIRVRNKKLEDNKRFGDLVKILGLDFTKTYDKNTLEGQAEFKTLRYGRVIICTDADTDGAGQIFGLLLNFFILFWPKLNEWNFITRMNTPIIRCYPKDHKKLVQEFCTMYSFKEWVNNNFGGDEEKVEKSYTSKYFKGLATHSIEEVRPMFKNFESKLYTYMFDEDADKSLEIYFGKATDPRKKALSTPLSPDDEIKDELSIPITQFTKTDLKEFQLDNLQRKLPHEIDGMTIAKRKTFFVARDAFKSASTKEIKVCNFVGQVINKSSYHHGDASLSNTIIKMCQNFVGAKNLPLLIGVGEFGSRIMGGNDAGSPRYVFTKLNHALAFSMFPKDDDYILNYEFDEGNRIEPSFYCPIIPLAVLESVSIPASGWKNVTYARDYQEVITNVKKMVMGTYKKCKSMKIWLRDNRSEVRESSNGKQYIVGKYTHDIKKNIICITELPPGVFNDSYIKSVAFDKDGKLIPEIIDYYDYSNYDEETNLDEIKIQFEMAPGAVEKIKNMNVAVIKGLEEKEADDDTKEKKATKKKKPKDDKKDETKDDVESLSTSNKGGDDVCSPLEKFFKLRICVNSHLNMIGVDKAVREYKLHGYEKIIDNWFVVRKEMYAKRIDRMIILTRLMIRYLENIIRFSENRDNYNITNKTPEIQFNKILKKNKYDTFDRALLLSPKYTHIDDLEKLILNSENSSYEYIINLTYRSLLEEACKKRSEELEAEKLKLQNLLDDCETDGKKFVGRKTWLAELEILDKIITQGVAKGWSYSKNKARFE